MQLVVGHRYQGNGFNGTVDGNPVEIANLVLFARDGDGFTVEPDETPSDNEIFINAGSAVGETDLMFGTATSADGSRKLVMVPVDVALVAEDVPPPDGNFEIQFIDVTAA